MRELTREQIAKGKQFLYKNGWKGSENHYDYFYNKSYDDGLPIHFTEAIPLTLKKLKENQIIPEG